MPPIPPIRKISRLSNALLSSPAAEGKLFNGTTEESSTATLHEPPDIKVISPSSTTYITLTISLPSTTSATIVPLGDSFSTSVHISPSPSPNSGPSLGEKEQSTPESPSSNSTVGIVIGCIAAFVLLLGFGYVWFLRGKSTKGRKKKRKTKKRKKKKPNGEKPGKKKGKRRRRVFRTRKRKRRMSKSGSVRASIYFQTNLKANKYHSLLKEIRHRHLHRHLHLRQIQHQTPLLLRDKTGDSETRSWREEVKKRTYNLWSHNMEV